MSEVLQISEQPDGNRVVRYRVRGRLDASGAPILAQKCAEARAAGRHVVLNLEGVTFIASSGVGAMLAAAEQAREAGTAFRLVALSPSVDSVIRLLNLDQFLPIDSSEDEAVSALKAA